MKIRDILKRNKIIYIICFLLLFLYTFVISHVDCNTITTWAYDLLESIRQGEIRDYPIYTYELHGMATNYSLTSNIVNAIWILPLFFLDKVLGLAFEMRVYDTYMKIFVLIVLLISMILFDKVLVRKNFLEEQRHIALISIMSSSILLISVLAKGQIDAYGMFFIVLAMYMHVVGRIKISFLMIGLACLFKPFALLLGMPYFLLMFKTSKTENIFNGFFLVFPYIVDFVITKFVMPRYFEMSNITSLEFKKTFGRTRLEEIFDLKINSIYVFFAVAFIICFICFYIGVKRKVKDSEIVVFSTMMFLVYGIFVNANAIYWFLLILPSLICMGINLSNINIWLILNFGINLGVPLFIMFSEKSFMPGTEFTLLNRKSEKLTMLMDEYVSGNMGVVSKLGTTIFMTSMILVFCIYVYEKRNGSEIKNSFLCNRFFGVIIQCLQLLPAVVYLFLVCCI